MVKPSTPLKDPAKPAGSAAPAPPDEGRAVAGCPACRSARFVAADQIAARLDDWMYCCLDCGCLFLMISPGLRGFLLEKAGYER